VKSTAISKLKASLSQYLSMVKSGEEIIITDRGKPIAKIVPLKSADLVMPPHLKELERSGLVRIGRGSIHKKFWELLRPKASKGSALVALLKARDQWR